jgi:hypothetical protein
MPFLLTHCSILRVRLVSFSLLFLFSQYRRIFQRSKLRRSCVDTEKRVLHVWVSVDTHQYISCPQASYFLTCVVFISPQKGENWQWYIAHCNNWSQDPTSTCFQFLVYIDLPFRRLRRLALTVCRQYLCKYFLSTEYVNLEQIPISHTKRQT